MYWPCVIDTLPLKPSNAPRFITILIIPPTPSGSYFAEGFVIISTFSIMEAEIFSTSPLLPLPVLPLRFPSMRIVTFASPAIDTTPSISTSTDGIFLKTSDPEPPDVAKSFPTLNIFLSIVCTKTLSSPSTSTASRLTAEIDRFTIPISFFIPPLGPGINEIPLNVFVL